MSVKYKFKRSLVTIGSVFEGVEGTVQEFVNSSPAEKLGKLTNLGYRVSDALPFGTGAAVIASCGGVETLQQAIESMKNGHKPIPALTYAVTNPERLNKITGALVQASLSCADGHGKMFEDMRAPNTPAKPKAPTAKGPKL